MCLDRSILLIDGHLDRDRARAAGDCQLNRLPHHLGDLFGARRPKRRLADAIEHRQLILGAVQEGAIFVDVGRVDLAGDVDHWRARDERLEQRPGCVGGADAGAGHHRREATRGAGKPVGHRSGAVLGASGHQPESALAGERVKDGDVVDADDAEERVHASGLQAVDDQLATGALHPR